jgi:MFS family permease
MIGEDNVQEHLRSILNSLHLERQNEPLFSWEYRLPIFLAISIGAFNQLSGINAVWYYLNDIFTRAGFNNNSSNLQAIMVGITNLIAGSIALWLIDRAGRKMLLLIGSVGCAASLFGVAFVFHSGTHTHLLLWFLISFIGFFAFSQGAVIWVYIGEIFPNRVRAKGQSLGSFAHWLTNAAVASIFPVIAVRSGTYPFVFFSSMMVLQFVVVLFVYPETKCVPLEMIQERLELE